MKLTTTTMAALAGAMLFSTPVSAADEVVEVTATASEFDSDEGTKRVLNRIRIASRSACSASAFVPPRQVRECRHEIQRELINKFNLMIKDERFVQLAVAAGLISPPRNG